MAKLAVDHRVRQRSAVVIVIFCLLFLAIAVRVLFIQVGNYERYQGIVNNQITREST